MQHGSNEAKLALKEKHKTVNPV